MKQIDAAMKYLDAGFSVIPIKTNKKPFIKWTDYQVNKPSKEKISEWWGKWPNANIGIVTGKVSGVTVIDADSEAGKSAAEEYFPDSLRVPTVKTPKGWHYYFRYIPGSKNGVRFLTDCDVRSEGGYVIAPPGGNGDGGKYNWIKGSRFSEIGFVDMPDFLSDILLQSSQQMFQPPQGGGADSKSFRSCFTSTDTTLILQDQCQVPKETVLTTSDHEVTTFDQKRPRLTTQNEVRPHLTTFDHVRPHHIAEGERDSNIFHLANCLIKGGMPDNEIFYYLKMFVDNCCESGSEQFTDKDILLKIKSAKTRHDSSGKNIAMLVRDFVDSTSGQFTSLECYKEIDVNDRRSKKTATVVLGRLIEEGIIERYGSRNGVFRKLDDESPGINIFKAEHGKLKVRLPMDLHQYYQPMKKNIVVIAGTQDVGKTAFMLNCAKLNMNHGMPIRYFTSEMGASELRSRLELFEPEMMLNEWKGVEFKDKSQNFQDEFLPDGINIVDYLEISDAFYQIGEQMKNFYNKLRNGIAIIAIQKDFKADLGRGGTFSLEKPRLYVTLTARPGKTNLAKIVKCKNWVHSDRNPNGRFMDFKVIKGSEIRPMNTTWQKPNQILED